MQLRWLVRKHPSPTLEAVKAYNNLHACGLIAAKKALGKPDETVLQMFDGAEWVDVPTVTLQVNQ